MTKQMILIGEIRIGAGCVHQQDFATALEAARLTQWPKAFEDVEFVVGRLLKGRKPAMLTRAEKGGIETVTVESLLTPEVRQRLVAILKEKATLAPYEQVALDYLKLSDAQPTVAETQPEPVVVPKKRGGKKKAVANG